MSRSAVVVAPSGATASEEYLTVPEVAARFKLSQKTVRNRMYDGTWSKGVIWFSPRGLGPRFKWSALVAWIEQDRAPSDAGKGLAYSGEIPLPRRGRPRRVDGGWSPAVHGA